MNDLPNIQEEEEMAVQGMAQHDADEVEVEYNGSKDIEAVKDMKERNEEALAASSTSSMEQDDNSDTQRFDSVQPLDPPPSCGEDFRDFLLRFLDRPIFQLIGILVIFVIIADGALFFFLLVGWHTLCDEPSKTDCNPRNDVYNVSIQILNVCFTYMAVVSMPWRSTQFMHTVGWSCPYRDNNVGRDIYGLETNEIWYFIERKRRIPILLLLLGNCIAQFINQGTRIYFFDFEDQDEVPGNIWTNVFFFLSMIFAGMAGCWQVCEENRIRKAHPGVFTEGPLQQIRQYLKYPCQFRKKRKQQQEETEQNDEEEKQEQEPQQHEEEEEESEEYHFPPPSSRHLGEDHTRFHRTSVLPLDRTGMRLWAM